MAQSIRISQQFRPNQYDITLQIDSKLKTVQGQLVIFGERRSKPSNRITLHQTGLRVKWAKVFLITKEGEQELDVERLVHHNKFQELRIHTKQRIESAKYRLDLIYSSRINTQTTTGLYLSSWHDQAGLVQELIASQLQPSYARSIFPCIDEPEAKAVFNLTLIQPEVNSAPSTTTLFNTPVDSTESKGGQNISKFKSTPVMSSYLLALVIGQLESVTVVSKRGIKVSIYATSNKIEHADFGLEYAAKVLDFLEDYFKIDYPLEKCDLVAVPDFESGGMENWGLITFREDLLLFDDQLSTLSDKQAIALTVAHEIAHQWFGNLVTMKWWDELWLNEGFANFMEFYIVDQIFPEWRISEECLVSEKSSAIRLDSLPSSKAIIKKVSSPLQALECFDEIAYEKSGSIVRMLHSLIGESSFKLGLNDYFQKYQYKSASSQDLIKAWQKYSKIDLDQFVKTWLHQSGLPVVKVQLSERPNLIKLTQSRFLSEKPTKINLVKLLESVTNDKPNIKKLQKSFYLNQLRNNLKKQNDTASLALWQIPINFVSTIGIKDSIPPFILKKDSHLLQLSSKQALPLKLNKNGAGFYLTSYSLEFLAQISLAIQCNSLNELDTLNLLSDFISLDKAGQFEPGSSAILSLIYSAKNSRNSHFWGLAGGFLANINHHLRQSDQQKLLEPYGQSLLTVPKTNLGLSFTSSVSEADNTTSARFEVLSIGVMVQDPQTHALLLANYDQNLDDFTQIHPEQRILALYCAAKRGKKEDYDLMQGLYKSNAEDISLREDLMYALTSFEDTALAIRSIALIQDSNFVRAQDVISWVSLMISSSTAAKKEVLNFITKQNGWVWLSQILTTFDVASTARIIFTSAYNKVDLNKLKKFFEAQQNPELDKAISEAVDMAKSRILWASKELPGVIEYLNSFAKK
jgi:aminopeptidase N